MVAWYPLDELTGATAVNDIAPPPSSTVNNVGSPTPGPQVGSPNGPTAIPGQVSGAFYFAGPYVDVPPQSELDFGTGDFTLDAWIKPVTIVDANALSLIVYKVDANSGTGYALYTQGNQSGGRELKLVMNGTTYTSNAAITSASWYHVAVIVDRSNSAGAFYVNGAPAGSFVPVTGSVTNTASMLIGASFLSGLLLPNVGRHEIAIDELELFNRALAPSEIQAIFNAGSAGKCKNPPTGDLGDAPDSSNNAPGSPQMTAYPGTPAHFPTVFNSIPPGPRHLQPKAVAWLGPNVTFEDEADVGPDQDPSNNIIPILDQANKDLRDDGLVSPPVLPTTFCSQVTFTYSVSFAAVTTQPLYVNVWFDFNQDGDWEDSGRCAVGPTTTGLLSEWAVQDQVIPASSGPAQLTVTTPLFMAQRLDAAKDVWMRITLSDQPALDPDGLGPLKPDGRGPGGGFKYGETEDYLLRSSAELSEVCGMKFNDLNANGVKDPGESGLPGWTIALTPGSLTTTTDANGNYCFGPLAAGTYTVSEVLQAGWTQTLPGGPGTYTVTVPPSVANLNFGNCHLVAGTTCAPPQLSEVCGMKFNDVNANGVRDPGESGLPGWTIALTPGSLTTTTDASGNYCFGPLAAGTYTVSEVLQAGWTQTLPGGLGTYSVTVPPSVANLNFGNCHPGAGTTCAPPQLSEVCGMKFNDVNHNGIKDLGESGLPGWTITLTPGSLTTTTDASGNYCFGPLAAGTYTVSEVLQAGWTQTLPGGLGTYSVTVPPSVANLNFGNCHPNAAATC
jgi:Concanavalin A-like lectin/glucanases superfamily/SdrD B-like domain/GEVED domain